MGNLILIVDDTNQNLQVLGSMLKNEGYNIGAVTNGEEALNFVQQRVPDLILLDVMMPGLDGYEVCQKLKGDEETEDIPVIFISALNEVDDKIKGFEVGGVDYITKPFQKQEVLARVKTHIELRENRKRVNRYTERLEERNFELERLQSELNEELEKGKKLHQQFLPDELPHNNNLSTAVYYQLAQKLGGDFYNFIEFNDHLIGYIVDITGHGLDGALLNIFVREAISNFLGSKSNKKEVRPSEILEFIYNKYAQEQFSEYYFICIGLFILDKDEMDLTYSNAGLHFPPLLVENKELRALDSQGLPISTAVELEVYDFDELKIDLEPGDKLLIMTDGMAEEARGDEQYGVERIEEVVEENKELPIKGIVNKVKSDFNQFIDDEACNDDVTLLGLEHDLEVIDSESFQITSDFSQLDIVKERVKEFLNVKCAEIEKVLIGFHELLVNAIEHGNLEKEDKLVTVTLEESRDYVRLVIEDEGTGFDWNTVLKEEEIYDNWEDSGRGLRIADLACDSVYYNTRGNKVFLIQLKSS